MPPPPHPHIELLTVPPNLKVAARSLNRTSCRDGSDLHQVGDVEDIEIAKDYNTILGVLKTKGPFIRGIIYGNFWCSIFGEKNSHV